LREERVQFGDGAFGQLPQFPRESDLASAFAVGMENGAATF
jgi:hypothetical protein